MSYAVVLGADYSYITQLETTIKSLIYHNHNLKIYVINSDIPQEWFAKMNDYFTPIGIKVIDKKLNPAIVDAPVSYSHISSIAFARLLIPTLIPEERVLYLDSDLVVNASLHDLFHCNMHNYCLAAIPDNWNPHNFNSGVLLIDNQKLQRQKQLPKKLLQKAMGPKITHDQEILNDYFGQNYLHLPDTYNACISLELFMENLPSEQDHAALHQFYKRMNDAKPFKIVHYAGDNKPWRLTSTTRLRKLWWQYSSLEPEEIINHNPLPEIPGLDHQTDHNIYIFTYSANVMNLEKIVQDLPNITFHVAAHTFIGQPLLKLLQYPNVKLYPNVISHQLKQIFQHLDVYLDIGFGPHDQKTLQQMNQYQIPILSFQQVASHDHDQQNYLVFDNNDVAGMVKQIKNICFQREEF